MTVRGEVSKMTVRGLAPQPFPLLGPPSPGPLSHLPLGQRTLLASPRRGHGLTPQEERSGTPCSP